MVWEGPEEEGSTTDFEAEENEKERDPTEGLPPVQMSTAWADSGTPRKRAGWWGRGAPIQGQAGHVTKDIEDGIGLFSPGRWGPKDRRFPNLGAAAEDFFGSTGSRQGRLGNSKGKKVARQAQRVPIHDRTAGEGQGVLGQGGGGSRSSS